MSDQKPPSDQSQDYNLSDYQKKRLDNIKRNNARLCSLGLISALEENKSNALAAGLELKKLSESENEDSSVDGEWDDKTRKRKRTLKFNDKKNPKEGIRKSLRQQGIGIDLEPLQKSKGPNDNDSVLKEREERVIECRETRLKAAKAVAECGAKLAAKENPTATYEHCLMRVRSMTEKGLRNRVKAIERAAGKHCVVKMAIFKSCLQDEDMWALAEEARDALERLKALKPIPD